MPEVVDVMDEDLKKACVPGKNLWEIVTPLRMTVLHNYGIIWIASCHFLQSFTEEKDGHYMDKRN